MIRTHDHDVEQACSERFSVSGETMPGLVYAAAQRTPGRVAWTYEWMGRRISSTWESVWNQVCTMAAVFRARGIGKGDVLAIQARTCREWQLVEWAGMLAGAVIAGIDTRASGEAAERLLQDSGACALVVDRAEVLGSLSPAVRRGMKLIVVVDGAPGGECGDNMMGWEALEDRCAMTLAVMPEVPQPDDIAVLIYTSGTTGSPKCIEYTHRQLAVAAEAIARQMAEVKGYVSMICWLPMAHLLQRMMNAVMATVGGGIHFCENPREVLNCAKRVHPTLFVGVPRFYEKFYEQVRVRVAGLPAAVQWMFHKTVAMGRIQVRETEAGRSLPWWFILLKGMADRLLLSGVRSALGRRMRFLFVGSAQTPGDVLEFFHAVGMPLFEAYGLSENTVLMTMNTPGQWRAGSVGKILEENEVRLADDQEVLVRGPGVFRGYRGEAGTNGRFTRDGFYRTGDCGFIDEDGFLYLTGRKADLIKTSTGRRISPVAVESVFRGIAGLDRVVIFGNNRKHLVALAVPAMSISEAESFSDEADRIVEAMGKRNLGLPRHERLPVVGVLDRPFTIEGGEMTSSLKLRRAAVERKYEDLIQALYSANEAGGFRGKDCTACIRLVRDPVAEPVSTGEEVLAPVPKAKGYAA